MKKTHNADDTAGTEDNNIKADGQGKKQGLDNTRTAASALHIGKPSFLAVTNEAPQISGISAGKANDTNSAPIPPGREALTVPSFESETAKEDEHQLQPGKQHYITLFTDQSDLQAELITSLLETKLPGIVCETISDLAHMSTRTSLLLIDCLGRQNAVLRKLGEPLQNACSDSVYAAVFNAEQSAACEDLLDWPCLHGIFYTDTNTEQLVRGMRYLLDGDYWVPRRLLHHFFDKNRKTPVMPSQSVSQINLTKREIQILTMIRDGDSNQDISRLLDLSEHTIKSHLYNTYRKIGVKNRMEAAKWARSISDKADSSDSAGGDLNK